MISTSELAHTADEAIFVLDAQGVCQNATPTLAALLGYPPETLIGMPGASLVIQKSPNSHPSETTTDPAKIIGLRHRDGSQVDVRLTMSRMELAGQTWQIWVAHPPPGVSSHPDDSAPAPQVDLVDAPPDGDLNTNEMLQLAIETAHLGIWTLDLASGRLEWNNQLLKIYGISRAEFERDLDGWRKQVHPEDTDNANSRLGEVLAGKSVFDVAFRIIWPNGEIRHISASAVPVFDEAGRVVKLIGINQDVTSQVKRQQDLNFHADITKSMGEAAIATDLAGNITFWNQAAQRIYGWDKDEVMGKSILDITPTEASAEQAAEIMESLKQGASWTGTFRVKRKNGESFPAHVSNSPLYDAAGKLLGIIGISNDISEQKKDEEARQKLLARLELALKASGAGVWDRDDVAGVVRFDERMLAIYGLTKETFGGTVAHWLEMVHPNYREVAAQASGRVAHADEIISGAYDIVRPDGEVRNILAHAIPVADEQGAPVGAIGVNIDITEANALHRAIEEGEMLYRSVVNSLSEGVVVYDLDGKIVMVNDAASQIVGLPQDSLVGRQNHDPIWQALREDGTRYSPDTFPASVTLRTGQPVDDEIMRVPDRSSTSGRYKTIVISSRPILDGETMTGVVAAFADVTDLRQSGDLFYAFFTENVTPVYWIELDPPVPTDLPVDEQVDAIFRSAYIKDISPSIARLYGFASREETLGRRLADMYKDDVFDHNGPTHWSYCQWVRGGYKTHGSEAIENVAEGEPRWMLSNTKGVFEDGRLVRIWGSQIDIHDRVKAETALRRSEERYRQITKMLSTYAYAYDVNEDGSLHQSWVIGDFEEVTGLSIARSEERGGWARLLHPDDLPIALERQHRLMAGQQDTSEFRIVRDDGDIRWLRDHGHPVWDNELERVVRIYGAAQDITDIKRSEESNRLLSKTVEQSPVTVMITDVNGTIVYVNPRFTQVTGYTVEEAIGQNANLQRSGTLPQSYYAKMWETLRQGQAWQGEFHNLRKNGEAYWELASIVGVQDDTGEITHYIAIKEDITERKRREEEHRRQERLATVGQLAAGIAHDFNNILAAITLYNDLIGRNELLSPKGKERVNVIAKQARHASRLVNQILDFSRKSILQRHQIDLVTLVREHVLLLIRTLPEHIIVEFTHSQPEIFVHADPTRMQQILTNLAVNARDAMPDGGRLHINLATLNAQSDCPSTIPDLIEGEWAKMEISDSGSGIAADVLPHIFNPFFTTKPPGEGSGLGLSQVHGIVAQHGGHIEVQSKQETGTTFTIYLPLSNLAAPETAAPGDRQINLGGKGEQILVVEDEPILREALADTLTSWNYLVIQAHNGKDALAKLDQPGHEIKVVISDVVMPVMGGLQLAQVLHQRQSSLPTILLSGHPKSQDMESFEMSHVIDWLMKPLDLDSLAQAIRTAIGE